MLKDITQMTDQEVEAEIMRRLAMLTAGQKTIILDLLSAQSAVPEKPASAPGIAEPKAP